MKVILLKDVVELGVEGEVKDVSLGYARNYLIPKGLVEEATQEKIKEVEDKKAKESKNAEVDLEKIEKIIQKLEGQTVKISAKASEEGTLYAAVSAPKVAAVLKDMGFDIRKDQINVGHVKEIGEHELVINLDHGLEARVTLIINSE